MLNVTRTKTIELLAGILVALVAFACASTPATPPPPDKDKLLAAGFKLFDAKTRLQEERIEGLPQGRVSEWQVTSQTFFVYPDLAKKQLYVGTQKEWDAYRVLDPGAGAGPSLAQRHAADMASYNKTDDRMRINTANDLTDPWSLWGDVEGLGGR